MANWKRGFFRLWILLSILWLVFIGIAFSGSIANPYVSPVAFTYKGDVLERIDDNPARYKQVTEQYVNGFYDMVTFDSLVPNTIFYAPNIVVVTVAGKKYEMGFTKHTQTDRATLVGSLIDYIAGIDPALSSNTIRTDVEAAVPAEVKAKYQSNDYLAEMRDFAIALYESAKQKARTRTIFSTAVDCHRDLTR